MKNKTLQWLYAVPKRKKLYILALMLIQVLNGASGVLYALLLRNIVDSAAAHDRSGFWRNAVLTVLLVLAQIGMRTAIRWLTELSKSTFENLFKSSAKMVDCAENIVVLKTMSGMAQAVCASLDNLEMENIVGTIAGDDTIFIVMRNKECATELKEKFKNLL